MSSGWNQTGDYIGITLVLENWGVKMGGVQRGPNRFFNPDLTTPEA